MHQARTPIRQPTPNDHSTLRPGRLRALAACLSVALTAPLAGLHAAPSRHVASSATARPVTVPKTSVRSAPQKTWTVKNCNDSGADSLREIIENPMNAQSGDTIDLGELPVRCGMTNSRISLGSDITIVQDDLTLNGPTEGSVTISGGGTSRVFLHTGQGTLVLNGLSVMDGYLHYVGDAYGGCIESDHGNITLSHVIVSNCIVVSDVAHPNGGGISAFSGNVTLIASEVSRNEAKTSGGDYAWGGGIYSGGSTFAKYSSISYNVAKDGVGGGVFAHGITLVASTIDNNVGGDGGGVANRGQASILNTTISGNTASRTGGALDNFSGGATIANSTIAFNQAEANFIGGIYFDGTTSSDKLTLQSSIVANNTSGVANSDIFIVSGHGTLSGANNLVVASNVSDTTVITVTSDPKLGPLQLNGGPTKTHMLLAGSPALREGNITALPAVFASDQRGAGYPRTTGLTGSVDLGSVQFDSIFADTFNWQF